MYREQSGCLVVGGSVRDVKAVETAFRDVVSTLDIVLRTLIARCKRERDHDTMFYKHTRLLKG